jgi:hypothetical protein
MNRHAISVLALALPAVSGCFYLPSSDEESWESEPVPYERAEQPLLVESGSQSGTLGDVADFSAFATASNATYRADQSTFRLDSIGEGWWVMSVVEVVNLDILRAPPGTYLSAVPGSYDPIVPHVGVIGCSGPQPNNFVFDGPAEEAEVTLTDNGDGSRTVEYRASFRAYDGTTQVVFGSAIVRTASGG